MTIRIALPTGDPRQHVGELLAGAGIAVTGYEPSSRVLRSENQEEGITSRVFRERDIPIQVALGNYHLGICGDLWITELQVRFPLQRIVRIGALPGPRMEVWLCAAPSSGLAPGTLPSIEALRDARIASELPNLADLVAVHLRAPGYHLLSLYGSADAYPPEDADLVLLPCNGPADVEAKGMVPLVRIFQGGLSLIANADALANIRLAPVLERFGAMLEASGPSLTLPRPGTHGLSREGRNSSVVRLALPDGHAQRHTYTALRDAGLSFGGYEEKTYVRRPATSVDGLDVKVVRPQDMPQLVAMGMFDIAVTGVDWLTEHLQRFPGSPVKMVVDLGRSRYKIGPVVDEGFPVDTTAEALPIWNGLGRPTIVASEYPALAESFARSVGLHRSTILPINGASEGFVPEDADILIEGSETGTSIRANKLKMLDPFMESTNCVIVRTEPATSRIDLVDELVRRFEQAAVAAGVA